MIEGYLTVLNAVIHVAQSIARREYQPGLVKAVLFLLSAGSWCVLHVGSSAGIVSHAVGLAVAIGVHVAIITYVALRLSRMNKEVR